MSGLKLSQTKLAVWETILQALGDYLYRMLMGEQSKYIRASLDEI